MKGEKIGKWTILKNYPSINKYYEKLYLCRCDCGTQKKVRWRALRDKTSFSCGCHIKQKSSLHNMSGKQFGRWKVIKEVEKTKPGRLFLCRCRCGKEKKVEGSTLVNGKSKSCGCLASELTKKRCKFYTDEQKNSKEFKTWLSIKNRCHTKNKRNKNYKWYAGRGISVSKEWADSFGCFLKEMGKCPSPSHSIERIDNNKGYNKDNCKWATSTEQARNRKTNHLLTYNGETKSIAEWSEEYNLKQGTLLARVTVQNWPVEKALTTPVGHSRK